MVSTQQNELTDIEKDEAAVKSFVEQFLIASVNFDIEPISALFSKKTISVVLL